MTKLDKAIERRLNRIKICYADLLIDREANGTKPYNAKITKTLKRLVGDIEVYNRLVAHRNSAMILCKAHVIEDMAGLVAKRLAGKIRDQDYGIILKYLEPYD